MQRTQIYLTAQEAREIGALALQSGRKRSEVIREAIDQYLERAAPENSLSNLRAARGMWKDRQDLDLVEIRRDFDRY